jgi:hypothetical protein
MYMSEHFCYIIGNKIIKIPNLPIINFFAFVTSDIFTYLHMMACLFLKFIYLYTSFVKMSWVYLLFLNLLQIFDNNLFIFLLAWLKCSLKELYINLSFFREDGFL